MLRDRICRALMGVYLSPLIKPISRRLNNIIPRIILSYVKNRRGTKDPVWLNEKNIKELRILSDREKLLTLMPKHGIVAELGVCKGDFAEKIVKITKPRRLYLIDTWGDTFDANAENTGKDCEKNVQEKFKKEISSGRVMIRRGLSYKEMGKFDDGYFDFVYIDTDHTYRTTKKELEICCKKVKNGGVIAGHDYTVDTFHHFGVVDAVNEFCMEHGWEMRYLTHEPHRYLSYGLMEMRREKKQHT